MNGTSWATVPLRYISLEWCDGPFGSGIATEHYCDNGARVVRLQNIRMMRFDDRDAAFIDERYYREQLSRHDVREGDVLVAGLGDANNLVGRACVAPAALGPALVKADCFRFRIDHQKADARFVAYSLCSSAGWAAGALSSGSTRRRINLGTMASRKVALPGLHLQQRIADFLDERTCRIDLLIQEKVKLIERLEEQWQSNAAHLVGVADETVTKGWTHTALKRVAISRCDGPFGSALTSAHYTPEGVRVVRLQNIGFARFDDINTAFIDEDYFDRELEHHAVVAGDVLIAGLGDESNLVGRACVAPDFGAKAMVKADCFRFRLDTSRALPQFVALQLSASAHRDAKLATGSTRKRIPLSITASRHLALPSLPEQECLAQQVMEQRKDNDNLVAHCRAHIDHLLEYRSSLVAAAVTGEIDITASRPLLPEAA